MMMIIFSSSVYAQIPEEFKNFPSGSEPEFIGSKLAQHYNSIKDTETQVVYPEVCFWFGTLKFADATKDADMLKLLENRFIRILENNPNALQTKVHVDRNVFGIVPLQLNIQTGKKNYYDIGIDYADSQWTMPSDISAENRLKYQDLLDKGLSWQTRYWIDDMFMITAIQTQAYVASKNEIYLNRAAHEITAYLDSLQRPNGLFYHSPRAPFFWGRGNGWVAAGMADLLTYLPENSSYRPKIMAEFRQMMETLKSYRNEEGLWNQLVDEPDAWTETSGSAMFTYAMITGVRNGWLDAKEYAPIARKAWLALVTYLNESYRLREICEGTNTGTTKQYYLDRKRLVGDHHGQAALFWCATALYDTERNSLAELKSLSYNSGTLTPAFNPEITDYTCQLPSGVNTLISRVEPIYRNKAVFDETVNVSSGSTSIVVTSADGSATKTYTVRFETGKDVDYTSLIVNNDFEYMAEGVPMTATTWKPKDEATNQGHNQFYGWTLDLDALGGSSQGINKDFSNHHGTYGCWISNSAVFPDFFEFHQTVNNLEAGTYKVQCLLSGTKQPTSQRLFANKNVQYFKSEVDYQQNQTAGEIATFAGYANPAADNQLSEMAVYTTVAKNEPLKIGIRTGSIKGDGTVAGKQWGWFKVDYFRLTKIDNANASDANLSGISLSTGNLDFSPEKTVYDVKLPKDTRSVTVTGIANLQDATVSGSGIVDVSSGSGISTLTVTALDGSTTKTYTVNYKVDGMSSIEVDETPSKVDWYVSQRYLVVKGVDAYTVYNINGLKVADVRNSADTGINLNPGIYIIRTEKNTETFKVIVK